MIAELLLLAAASGMVDPFGLWLTEDAKSHVEIRRCGDDLCGTIVDLTEPYTETGESKIDVNNPELALRDRPVIGIEILRIGARPDDRGVWRRGSIYDPENGKTYKCKMWLVDANTLRLKGYIGVSVLGRTVEWKRADPIQSSPGP